MLKELIDFDNMFSNDEPDLVRLAEFLSYLNTLMWTGDELHMAEALNRPTKDTSTLMLVALLRGLCAYRRRHPLNSWDKALAKYTDWLIVREEDAKSILRGLFPGDGNYEIAN